MVTPRDDQLVEKLWPDFVGRQEGIPIWKQQQIGAFFDPDDLELVLRFDDHRLDNPTGTLGNYIVGTRDERIPILPLNAAQASRGGFLLKPSLWPGIPAFYVSGTVTNQVTNPSLEVSAAGITWGAGAQGAGWGRVDDDAVFGSWCGKAVCFGAANRYVYSNMFTRGANDDVTVSVYVRTNSAPTSIRLGIVGNLGGSSTGPQTSIDSSWTLLRYTVLDATMDAWAGGGLQLFFYIYNDIDASNQDWNFDGMQATFTDYYEGDVDGDMGDGYSWSGVPHASTSVRTGNYPELDNYVDKISQADTLSFTTWVQAGLGSDDTFPTSIAYVMDARGAANNDIRIIFHEANDYFYLYINGTSLTPATTLSFDRGDWIHIAVTVDFTNDEYILYVNGEQIEVWTNSFVAPTLTDWVIGGSTTGALLGNWTIAEFVTLNRVITKEEVANLYMQRRPVIDGYALDKQLNTGIVVYNNADQAIGTGAATTIQLNTVDYNEHMVFDSAAYRVLITQPGWYAIAGSLAWQANATGDRRIQLSASQKGAGVILAISLWPTSATGTVYMQISTVEYFVPGDYIILIGWQNSGGNLNAFALPRYGNYLRVVKIRNLQESLGV